MRRFQKTNNMIRCIMIFFVIAFFHSLASGKTVVVEPVEIFSAFKNPGIGWIQHIYGHPTSEPANFNMTVYSSVAYSNYFIWRDLEPNFEGDYRWELIDNFIDYWAHPSRNKKVSIGMHLTDPHSIPGPIHIPQWLYEDPRMTGRWYDQWYGHKCEKKYEPEYWNPYFLEKLGKFWKAMAEKYYSSPKWQKYLERIDISTYGYWGEWHSEIEWPDEETKIKTLRTMIDQYADAFPRDRVPTPMFAKDIVGWHGQQDLRDHGVYYAVEDLGAMMVRRCMGWPEAAQPHELQFLFDHYKTNKFHSEWGSIDGSLYKFPRGMNTVQAIQMALDLHSSMMGWYQSGGSSETGALNQIVPGTGETIEEYYQKRCGYRFVLSRAEYPERVKPGGVFKLKQTWKQKGVARLYEDYYRLKAYLQGRDTLIPLNTDQTFNATNWYSGKAYKHVSRFTIPSDIPEGQYILKIAVIDFTGEPAMNLAIAGKDESNPNLYGRYSLGEITVGSSSKQTEPLAMFDPSEASLIEELYYNEKSIRADQDGWFGIRVRVGDKPVEITAVGRYFLKGNKQTHPVKIVRVHDGYQAAETRIDMTDPYIDKAGFKYGLTHAVLKPQTSYYILSQEFKGKDNRLDYVAVKPAENTYLQLEGVAKDNYPISVVSTNLQEKTTLSGINIRYRPAWQPELKSMVKSAGDLPTRYIGMKVTVGDKAIRVSEIGKRYYKDKNGIVNLLVVRCDDNKAISFGNYINMDLGYANSRDIKYIKTDILLNAHHSYYVLCEETGAGHLDETVELVPSKDFTIDGPVSSNDLQSFKFHPKAGCSLEVLDLRYEYDTLQSLVSSVSLSPKQLTGPTGWYGMKITLGDEPVEVHQLGRYRRGGEGLKENFYKERGEGLSENHELRIVSADTLEVLASTAVGIWGKMDDLGFGYGDLGQPLTLKSNKSYYIVCNEMKNTDKWYSEQTKISTIKGISIDGPVYTKDFIQFDCTDTPGFSYGPLNIKVNFNNE